ncbi:hypothetical protein MLA66_004423 [Salmonella enterica]|nr:hypothetical protein [Salmonella enterica]EEM7113360.1 hypothetical protein [Salmonella enterica subsp. enterica serovar Poona]EAS9893672.1 hypothetical protein [Salmonella enterica]EEG2848735.1 hypothetical protein [Salmonella enterica]EEH1295233.1 hypothetical protein [Salmonella enterica]
MKKIFKYKSLFVLMFLGSESVYADIQCVGHYVGDNVSYQQSNIGDAFNKFSATLRGNWPGGGQSSKYLSWQSFGRGRTAYSVAIPKSTSLNVLGQVYKVHLNAVGAFDVPGTSNWQAFKTSETEEGCVVNTGGGWMDIHAGITSGYVSFTVQGRPLPSGQFDLTLPYILAWGTSPGGDSYEYLARRSWDYVGVGNVTGYFNVKMVIQNKCDISALNLTFDHGRLYPNQIQGHTVKKSLSVICDEVSTIKFTFTNSSPSNLEIKSNMKVLKDNKEITQAHGKKIDIDIVSELENTRLGSLAKEGVFSMNTVLMVEYV